MARRKQRRYGPLPSGNDSHVSFKMPSKDRERLQAYAEFKGITSAQLIRDLLIPQIRNLDFDHVELGEASHNGPLPTGNDAHVSLKMSSKDRERLQAYAEFKGITSSQLIRDLLIPQIRNLGYAHVELGDASHNDPVPGGYDANVSFSMPWRERERLYAFAEFKGIPGAQVIRALLIPQIRNFDFAQAELGEDQPSLDDVEQLKKTA